MHLQRILFIKRSFKATGTFAKDDYFDPDKALSAAVDRGNFLLNQLYEISQRHFRDSDDDNQ